MPRLRSPIIAAPVVAGALLLAAAAAAPGANTLNRPGSTAAQAAAPLRARPAGHPASRAVTRPSDAAAHPAWPTAALPPAARLARAASPAFSGDDATLDGDSCTSLTLCAAVGFYYAAAESAYFGLSENWNGQHWTTDQVSGLTSRDFVTWPFEVSCGTAGTCVLVGQHYKVSSAPAMMAESLNGGQWTITQWNDPPGTRMGWLGDVSCSGPAFCLAVGAYSGSTFAHERMFAEQWTGARWQRLTIPAPAKSRWSALGGVSCFSTTDCVAVGDYESAAGHVLSLADAWNGHGWTLTRTPNVSGERQSDFNAVSCASATRCLAVGFATGPGRRQFAEKWSGGRWRLTTMPRRTDSALIGVSCPATSFCMTSGLSGRAALTELWNGTTWRALRTASPSGTRSAADLQHVSCISVTHCEAVGFRYNPKVAASNRSLAEVWNGHDWRIQVTVNP